MLFRRNTTLPIFYHNYSHSQTYAHTQAKNSTLHGQTIHYCGLKYHVRASKGCISAANLAFSRWENQQMEDFWISLLLQLCGRLHSYKLCWRKVSWLTHKYKACSYMNTFGSTDDWHKCTYNTQGTYQGLPAMHTPTDVRHGITIIHPHPPPCSVPRVGWHDPSRSELLTHSCTCCFPPDCCSSALFGEHTHWIPHWWGGWMSNSHNLSAPHSCAVNLWQV